MLQSIRCLLVAASTILATAAQAAWPERPVTVVVPFTRRERRARCSSSLIEIPVHGKLFFFPQQ